MIKYFDELLSRTEALVGLGLIDHTLCKVLVVRQEVARLMAGGKRKSDAMWIATEKFCCSYEYVRKCMYYYTDIDLPEGDSRKSVSEKMNRRPGLIWPLN